MNESIRELFRTQGGVLRRRDHPAVARQLDWLLARRELVSPLPGVLTLPTALQHPRARILAGWLWLGPDAVVTGRAAAMMTFWPEVSVPLVTLAVPRHAKNSSGGWSVRQRTIPPELVWRRGGVNVTCPALTAVDLANTDHGGDVIDRALRSRLATLDQMWDAFAAQSGRRGNGLRQALLHDSRDAPWSEAERELHRLLRGAGITGWRTNVHVGLDGRSYFADVLFEASRLILEVDGYEEHGRRQTFEDDRRRRNQLVLAGFTVLNFTWRQLTEDPASVLQMIRLALPSCS